MAVKNLKCKECSTEYDLGANFFCAECFGPLEVRYDYSDLDPEETRRRIQAGSATESGGTPTSCPSRAAPGTRSSRA